MASLSKLAWYYQRLRSMSGSEIRHRLTAALKRKRDRNRKPFRQRDYGALPEIPTLKENLAKFDAPAELLQQWRQNYTEAKAGNFHLLGVDWPASEPAAKWHLDPFTQKPWPKDDYCFAIDCYPADGKTDVKYVRELSRLQYLQPIAALAFKTKEEPLAHFALGEVESWIDNNPPYKGVHWASSIEVALRAVSMLMVTTLTGDFATDGQRSKIGTSLRSHAWWLARYPSRFSAADSHCAAEGLGLFLIGTLCPKIPGAKRWQKSGWAMLHYCVDTLILDDGAGAEQSPRYTAQVVEMLLLALQVARAKNLPVPDIYMHKLAHAGEYLRWFIDAGGNVARIGDDDDSRVLGMYEPDETYVNSVTGSVAAMFSRADITPPAARAHLRNGLFGMPPLATPPLQGLHTFEQAGYSVGRHTVSGREVWLAVDHGSLGFQKAAHGHADALSLWLHLDGQPVLVDSGTYLYASGGKWRDYFRSTFAHNTLRMETTDSSAMTGYFDWSQMAKAERTALETGPAHWQIDMNHDGYMKRFGALHRRRVGLTPARGLTVEDSITGPEPRHVEINFLLHPSLGVTARGNEAQVTRGGKAILRLMHLSGLKLSLGSPGTSHSGWYSPAYGKKQETTRITYSGILAPGAKAVTDFTFVWQPEPATRISHPAQKPELAV